VPTDHALTPEQYLRERIAGTPLEKEINDPLALEYNVIAQGEALYLLNTYIGVLDAIKSMTYAQMRDYHVCSSINASLLERAGSAAWARITRSRNNAMAKAMLKNAVRIEWILVHGYATWEQEEKNRKSLSA